MWKWLLEPIFVRPFLIGYLANFTPPAFGQREIYTFLINVYRLLFCAIKKSRWLISLRYAQLQVTLTGHFYSCPVSLIIKPQYVLPWDKYPIKDWFRIPLELNFDSETMEKYSLALMLLLIHMTFYSKNTRKGCASLTQTHRQMFFFLLYTKIANKLELY